jgi:hypothetical protein
VSEGIPAGRARRFDFGTGWRRRLRSFTTRKEHPLCHPAESRETTVQIGAPCGDPDARSRWQPDHPSKHSIAVRSITTSTFPAARRVPFASWISIDPTANDEDPPPAWVAPLATEVFK